MNAKRVALVIGVVLFVLGAAPAVATAETDAPAAFGREDHEANSEKISR